MWRKLFLLIMAIGIIDCLKINDKSKVEKQNDPLSKFYKFATKTLSDLRQAILMLTGVFSITPSDKKPQHKQNFALKSSGALVVATKGGVIRPGNFLTGAKDSYTSFPCQGDKREVYIDFALQEDAYVEEVSLSFQESYTGFMKAFEVLLSIGGGQNSWTSAGVFEVKRGLLMQSFKFPKPIIARRMKLVVLSSYKSVFFYCTITQIFVHGVTYLSYSTEQTTKRITEQLQKEADLQMPQSEEVPESHLSLLSQQITKNRDVINDLQHFLMKGITIVKKQKNKKKPAATQYCPPLSFQQRLNLERSCSASGGIINKISEEGPLESYFDIISLKIEVKIIVLTLQKLEKKNTEFHSTIAKEVIQREDMLKVVKRRRKRARSLKIANIKKANLQDKMIYDFYRVELQKHREILNGKNQSFNQVWNFTNIFSLILIFVASLFAIEALKKIFKKIFLEKIDVSKGLNAPMVADSNKKLLGFSVTTGNSKRDSFLLSAKNTSVVSNFCISEEDEDDSSSISGLLEDKGVIFREEEDDDQKK